MPKEVWKSPCFVELVYTAEEKREQVLLEFLEYLVDLFASMGDPKAKEVKARLNKISKYGKSSR
jgi:hypothetical protein